MMLWSFVGKKIEWSSSISKKAEEARNPDLPNNLSLNKQLTII